VLTRVGDRWPFVHWTMLVADLHFGDGKSEGLRAAYIYEA
jgi:hypothetical protein